MTPLTILDAINTLWAVAAFVHCPRGYDLGALTREGEGEAVVTSPVVFGVIGLVSEGRKGLHAEEG